MDAAGEFAQLVDRSCGFGGEVVQLGYKLAGVVRRQCLCSASTEGKGDQLLLDAIVQVAFDTAAGLVGGGDDAGPGGRELRVQLGVVQGDGQLAGDEPNGVE